jgi:hypothetical protein
MAYKDYRVEVFIPAGRKRVMSILMDNLVRFRHIVDKVQVWVNTDDDQTEDYAWLMSLPDTYDNWVELHFVTYEQYKIRPKQMRTGLFYADNTVDKDTIYIRMDDDIVFIEDGFFVNLLDFRIEHPKYFLIFANIWNNAIISFIHQRLGNIPMKPYLVEEPYCMDLVGWQNPKFGAMIHDILQEHIAAGSCQDLFFDRADLNEAHRFSISCFCFFGKDFAEFGGVVGLRKDGTLRFDEEIWLTEVYPTTNKKINTICGSALVAHYSFLTQRPYLDTLPILQNYSNIGRQALSDAYYDLLPGADPTPPKRPKNLKTVTLPKLRHTSSISDALLAEMNGFEVLKVDNKIEIQFEGQVLKTLIGSNISHRDIDQALATAYRSKVPMSR